MLRKIISGGQTGVDRAALDAAIECHIAHGGFCPKGRLAEDGRIAECYQLEETESSAYAERTLKNIRLSDGTLILLAPNLSGPTDGTVLTYNEVMAQHKPHQLIELAHPPAYSTLTGWLSENHIQTLNIAGPKASRGTGSEIYDICLSKIV